MFSKEIHRYIFLFGIFSLAIGMMLGVLTTSLPMVILGANWLIEMDFDRKWEQLKSNKIFRLLLLFFLIQLFGLIYTSNIEQGINELRVKLPLFGLPIIFFSTETLSKKELERFFQLFILGALINISWCLYYQAFIHTRDTGRDTSRFMSHIRLGLFLNLAIVCCAKIFLDSEKIFLKIISLLSAIYIATSLFVLALFSGVIIFCLMLLAVIVLEILRQKTNFKVIVSIVAICVFCFLIWNLKSFSDEQLLISDSTLNIPIPRNNKGIGYTHFVDNKQMENGNFVFINLQPEELKTEWNRKFPEDKIDFDKSQNLIRYEILIRYMSSKNLVKDSVGLAQLNEDDFKNIKQGITNYKYTDWNLLEKRTYELINEYDEFAHHRTMNGHSVSLRLYYWKAAMALIKKHILLGVGTGDVQDELSKVYSSQFKEMKPEWYLRPHNQFLSVTVALGVFGFIVFVATLFYPVRVLRNYLSWEYYFYFGILIVSFLWEDTLETQAGVGFYVIFNSILLSNAWFNATQIEED